MKKLILSLIIFGFAIQAFSQIRTEKLSEVVISSTNYKYLNKTGLENASVAVSLLEQKVASFDLKNSEYYSDDYDYYEISFYIPEGYILAAYDKNGEITRTAERFNDVALPKEVIESVTNRFPMWVIKKDVYLVSYYESGKITKKYKITLENGDEKMKVKTDAEGNFL